MTGWPTPSPARPQCLSAGPQAELDRLELGFVQIAKATTFKAFYAGRKRSEGGIALDYFVPPALTRTVLLDGTKNARDPWYRNPVFATAAGGKRAAETGDHPGMVVRLSLENRSVSNVRNFLFHCFLEREFFTILTAIPSPAARCNTSRISMAAALRVQAELEERGAAAADQPVLPARDQAPDGGAADRRRHAGHAQFARRRARQRRQHARRGDNRHRQPAEPHRQQDTVLQCAAGFLDVECPTGTVSGI